MNPGSCCVEIDLRDGCETEEETMYHKRTISTPDTEFFGTLRHVLFVDESPFSKISFV